LVRTGAAVTVVGIRSSSLTAITREWCDAFTHHDRSDAKRRHFLGILASCPKPIFLKVFETWTTDVEDDAPTTSAKLCEVIEGLMTL
jgi:hypothetical protein